MVKNIASIRGVDQIFNLTSCVAVAKSPDIQFMLLAVAWDYHMTCIASSAPFSLTCPHPLKLCISFVYFLSLLSDDNHPLQSSGICVTFFEQGKGTILFYLTPLILMLLCIVFVLRKWKFPFIYYHYIIQLSVLQLVFFPP